jgi:hypothetical protein
MLQIWDRRTFSSGQARAMLRVLKVPRSIRGRRTIDVHAALAERHVDRADHA